MCAWTGNSKVINDTIYFTSRSPETFLDARVVCQEMGGDVIEITEDTEDAEELRQILPTILGEYLYKHTFWTQNENLMLLFNVVVILYHY